MKDFLSHVPAPAERERQQSGVWDSAAPPVGDPIVVPDMSSVPLTLHEWFARDLPEPDYLLGYWLSTTTRALLVADTGLGKTNFSMQVGMAVADGASFVHWQGRRPARVLYIDGEMSRRLFRQRLRDAVQRHGSQPETFFALSHEDIEGFAPLNTPQGQACLETVIRRVKPDLIIFDSIMCLTVGDMKDEESWQQTLPWARSLTRRDIGQIWVHHTGHDATRSYGSKTREWQLDTVLLMEAAARDDTDVSFALSFRKARERTPLTRGDFQPVKVALVNDAWEHDAAEVQRPGKASPMAVRWLDALRNAPTDAIVSGRKAVSTAAWQAECVRLGLIDPKAKPDSARSLFSKYRSQLSAANLIGCRDDLSWTV